MKLIKIALVLSFLLFSSVNFHAQHLKVDISAFGQSLGEAPNFTQWIMPLNNGGKVSQTFDSITVELEMIIPNADQTHYMKCQYANKDGQTYNFKLSYDGIWPHWKDDSKSVDMPYPFGGSIQMTIKGLPTGEHNIITYHNNPFNETKNWTFNDSIFTSETSDCIVSVNDEYVTTISPTVNNRNDATCAYTFFTVNSIEGNPVVINFIPAHNRSMDNIFLNGFEIDAPSEPSSIASNPTPNNGDMHVDVNNDNPKIGEENIGYTNLSWNPSTFAVLHDIYFGTDENEVLNANNSTTNIYKGNIADTTYLAENLSTHKLYYWRVDEIDAQGKIAKGEVWKFSPRRIAFPSAEGWGRFARGGRGGIVYHVTNLNDSGPGSFREAIEANEPRTVIFDVSGIIQLESRLILSNSYCTVAGQTAPGKGICIRDYDFGTQGGSDFIIRYVRVRVGKIAGTDKTLGGMGMGSTDHSIIDHCSISWSQDEAFSSRQAKNITLQRTLISEALHVAEHKNYPSGTSHGFAASIGGDIASFHHNLLAHCEGRNWSLAGGVDPSGIHTGSLDIRNNVVYNWDGRTTDGGAQYVNFVRNYYKPGPATINGPFTELNPQFENPSFGPQQYYVEGNVMENHHGAEGPLPPFEGVKPQGTQSWPVTVELPFFENFVKTQTAHEAYESVLANVGCNRPTLDEHDLRILRETSEGTFTFRGSVTNRKGLIDNQEDVGGWEIYPEEQRSADYDSDLDGMPNTWEIENGLNPNDPEDRNNISINGYTNLENYLNYTAGEITSVSDFSKSSINKFKLYQNYPNPFNPTTEIRFNVPYRTNVQIVIYDILGRKILELLNEEKSAGVHSVNFNGMNLSSGVYFYQINILDQSTIKKMIMIK
ncbi:MAG: T9SS type A sorting domain-containing protein [Ignavibacteriales bacterium]|nr:T9SS type A sorting domain-containing protein [Ignavibacteriales bacterium]